MPIPPAEIVAAKIAADPDLNNPHMQKAAAVIVRHILDAVKMATVMPTTKGVPTMTTSMGPVAGTGELL